MAIAGEDWTTFVMFFEAEEKSHTVDEEKRQKASIPRVNVGLRAYLTGRACQAVGMALSELQVTRGFRVSVGNVHGRQVSYKCKTIREVLALFELRKCVRMFLFSPTNCQI